MISIEIDDKFVEETYREVYYEVTKQIADLDVSAPLTRKKRIENPVSVVVLSKGIFKSKAVGVFPQEFVDIIVSRMSDGEQLTSSEKVAYFKEYMNICYGRFISRINNEIGHASRFVIPVVLSGTYRETGESDYKNRVEIGFSGEQGRTEMTIYYEVLPQHSSN